jgi:hypothetical protein
VRERPIAALAGPPESITRPAAEDDGEPHAEAGPSERPKPQIAPFVPPAAIEAPGPGEYRIAIVDDRLRVAADVDLRGAKELVKKLQRRASRGGGW